MPTVRIDVQGTLTVSDIVRFAYFNILRKLWPLLPIAALAPIINLLLYLAGDLYRDAAINLAPFSVLMLFWLVIPYISAKRQVSNSGFLREPMAFSFSAAGVDMVGPNFSSSFAWPLVKEVRETQSLILLYEGPNSARIVPKHFFASVEDVAACKSLISNCISPKAFKSAGVAGRWC